jgi:hypothetical protein
MKEINWNIFKAKFNGKETSSFEYLAYLLFCSEHNNNTGIFRFKNQTGIETEPIQVDQTFVGFQAKFYDTKIADNKGDIIDSIKKAKRENTGLTKILFYLNQEFSESKTKGKKDPVYKTEIEKEAKKLNIEIEWRVPSHFELQLSLPKNQYLNDYYFEDKKGVVDFLLELTYHTESLLFPVQTDIKYVDQLIKIDRASDLKILSDNIEVSNALLIHGEGGCGKTAMIKEFYNNINQSIPFYGFKAAEFNTDSINVLFKNYGEYSLSDFIKAHEEEPKKIVLIDSAERISDLDNQEPFKEFLSELLKNSWTVIFTTRDAYLDDLRFQFLSVFRTSFHEIRIGNISIKELELLATKHTFELPANSKLKKLIRNPFYLDEYLRSYSSEGNSSSYLQFKEGIWFRKIQNSSYSKNNTHLQREKCFLNIVQARTSQGSFYVEASDCSDEILALLCSDEIISFDKIAGGYFITHDIYEEWGQNIIVERAFNFSKESDSFLKKIGGTLPIRRAFRIWLSDKLSDNLENIKPFIENSIVSSTIDSYWKDEILTSILLSEYSNEFFIRFKDLILEDKHQILKKIIFLLRISCKEIDRSYLTLLGISEDTDFSYIITKPKGSGWSSVINLVYENTNEFTLSALHYVLPILIEWCSNYKAGSTTRQAGLIALRYYTEIQSDEDIGCEKSVMDKLINVIIQSSSEITQELVVLFDEVLEKGELIGRDPNYDLCNAIIASDLEAISIIKALPEYVLKFADLLWFESKKKSNRYDGMGTEKYYSISGQRDYFPASAYQTPIYWLLHFSYESTVNFVLEFTNKTIQSYVDSGFDESVEKVELTMPTGETHEQYLTHNLWNMYRGTGSPVTPYLLQSIHMALEKILLEMAAKEDHKTIENKLIYLIEKSNSASISSVVASVVLSQPNKLFNIAKILFSSDSFILFDRLRCMSGEREAQSVASIGFAFDHKNDRHKNERAKTFEQKHRQHSLESLILNFQFFKDEDISQEVADQRQTEIWQIIDNLYKSLPEKDKETDKDKTKRLLLARIDRRKMNPKVEKQGDKILIDFNPEIDEDLKKHSEDALSSSNDFMKHVELSLWANNKFHKKESSLNYEHYENNPARILSETKDIIAELNSGETNAFSFKNHSIPAYTCSALINHYSESLSNEDLDFCKEVIMQFAMAPFEVGYNYQISDGVEVAINAIPSLFKLFPEAHPELMFSLFLILFDYTPLGHYKRVCDYSVESIQSKLWESYPQCAKKILFAFIKYRKQFNKVEQEVKQASTQKNGWPQYSQLEVIETWVQQEQKDLESFFNSELKYDLPDNLDYNLEELEIIFKLVPNTTEDNDLRLLVFKILPVFAGLLLKNDRSDRIDYSIRSSIFNKYAYFVLCQDITLVDKYAQPFVDEFCPSENMADLFKSFIFAEDSICNYDHFWSFWNCFYDKIVIPENHRDYHFSKVIHNYFLAGNYWNENTKNWHSLKGRESNLFIKSVADIGHLSCTFDAVAIFLNKVGSEFLNQGIFWITELVVKNQKNKLETNTIYYVEQLARKYVFENRNTVRKEQKIKDKILIILNFLIENGSVNAYLLREDII